MIMKWNWRDEGNGEKVVMVMTLIRKMVNIMLFLLNLMLSL